VIPRWFVLSLFIVAVAARRGIAQAPGRWTFALEVGALRSSASGAMEDGMREAGYGDTSPGGCLFGFCSAGAAHPSTEGAEALVGVSLRYALRPGLQLRAIVAPPRALGTTRGYHAPSNPNSFGGWIDIGSRVGSMALVVAPVGGDVAWVELGPAVVHGEVAQSGAPTVSRNLPGLLAGVGLNLTPGRRTIVEVAARWRLTGSIGITPFGTNGTTIEVPMSYGSLGANVGLRF